MPDYIRAYEMRVTGQGGDDGPYQAGDHIRPGQAPTAPVCGARASLRVPQAEWERFGKGLMCRAYAVVSRDGGTERLHTPVVRGHRLGCAVRRNRLVALVYLFGPAFIRLRPSQIYQTGFTTRPATAAGSSKARLLGSSMISRPR